MKQNINLKTFILAAAVSLGAVGASAQSTNVAVPTPESVPTGLLGSRYTEVAYNYSDLSGGEHADGVGLVFNQPLRAGLDFTAGYNWAKADFSSFDVRVHDLQAGVRAFTNLSWGRPYAEASAGWEWVKAAGIRDDSFAYKIGVGTEFQVAPSLVITPFVNFVRATSFNASEVELGAKATYRLNREWSLTVRAQYEAVRHDDDSAEYSIGAIYHF
jgi:outer membrane scaffolding protein for murein synthesis (MipA/OmpV family)